MWILGPMAFEWLIAPQSPITCRFAIKNAFKRGTALSCSVLRFWVISEKPHFLAKNGTFWLIALVTLFAPQSPISHNFYMQNAFKWGITLLCSALRFPISSLSKGHVHCAAGATFALTSYIFLWITFLKNQINYNSVWSNSSMYFNPTFYSYTSKYT